VTDERFAGGRVDGVLVANGGTFTIRLTGVFGAPFDQPSYGFLIFQGGSVAQELGLVLGPQARAARRWGDARRVAGDGGRV